MLKNPKQGFCVPDDLAHEDVLKVVNPYLKPCVSMQTGWNPVKNRFEPFAQWTAPAQEPWQYDSFLAK